MSQQKTGKRKPISKKDQTEQSKPKAIDDTDFNLENVTINDSSWQSTIVVLKFDSSKMYNDFLQCFNVLPDDTALITKDTLERNQSKTDKQSTKNTKSDKISLKSNENSKKNKIQVNNKQKLRPLTSNTKEADHKSNNNTHCLEICKVLKQYILDLKRSDLVSDEERRERSNSPDNCVREIKEIDRKKYSGTIKNSSNPLHKLPNRNIILFGFDNREIINEMLKLGIIIKSIIHVKPVDILTENHTRLSTNKTLKLSSFNTKKLDWKAQRSLMKKLLSLVMILSMKFREI